MGLRQNFLSLLIKELFTDKVFEYCRRIHLGVNFAIKEVFTGKVFEYCRRIHFMC